jgi:hypothetical protein
VPLFENCQNPANMALGSSIRCGWTDAWIFQSDTNVCGPAKKSALHLFLWPLSSGRLRVLDQFFDTPGIGFRVAVTSHWVGPAR